MDGISSSINTYGLPGNPYGLIDKQSEAFGLAERDLSRGDPPITQRENLIMFDTRDCVGELSLYQAQLAFSYDAATRGLLSPRQFKMALNQDGIVVPEKLIGVVSELSGPDGPITGFPRANSSPYINGNVIRMTLPSKLKQIKSLEIINAIIPRDIIPMYVYFPGFIDNCIPLKTVISSLARETFSTWSSPIPETYDDFFDKTTDGINNNKLGGIYYTPLRYWRSYTGPNCMANPHTPPPYQLWNPPQNNIEDDPWPFQPQPIRGQRIPTYRARNGVVFSGYGLYDLEDFPSTQELDIGDGNLIQVPLRKLILKLLIPEGQYVNGVPAEELIDTSNDNDFNSSGIVDNQLVQTGYGDYQRFLPGPGLGMNYQPNQYRTGKAAPIDLSVSTYDPDTGSLGPMPVPFPNFRGNVWGPYGRPGDRFQNRGLQATVDELYLNGDLSNLEGNPIIFPNYNPSEESYKFEYFVINLRRANNIVRFQTFESTSNPNIKNAMRVEYDGGFGAVFAYIGKNSVSIGDPGPLTTGGLPNTQYDGEVHTLNHDIWMTPRDDVPGNWIQSLSGPQRPTIVSGDTFPGWIYRWRDIYPWTGSIYVPVTAGGTGPMEYFDGDRQNPEWRLSKGTSEDSFLTLGSSQWVDSPVIGQSNSWCLPQTNKSVFEFVTNLPYGRVSESELYGGGFDYQAGLIDFPGLFANYQLVIYPQYDNTVISTFITVQNVNSNGSVVGYTVTSPPNTNILLLARECVTACSNPEPVSLGNYALFDFQSGGASNTIWLGGTGYSVASNVVTISDIGNGSGMTIDIVEIKNPNKYRGILTYTINNKGSGYKVGDIVRVIQNGSQNNALIVISNVEGSDDNTIPENNIFHYMDPRASAPGNFGTNSSLTINYVEDDCQTEDPCNNCVPPGGDYVFQIGEKVTTASDSRDDPRPTPDPPSMLKCDFLAQETPLEEWNQEDPKKCRPQNNTRVRQTSNYICNRVSYNDTGPGNGLLISSLVSYRAFFVSSTPNTDLVIKITEAERGVYTQSLNSTISNSNFFIPIRLNLGTTSGTLEYVEAVQGTLTSSGVYWKKDYYPPRAELTEMELSFWTYDGIRIPLERCMGFIEQFNSQASLFASNIANSMIVHGNYNEFTPNLPPFSTTYANGPSSVFVSGNNNSKSLIDPYDPRTLRYTQRNLGLMFKVSVYQAQNPGISGVIRRMPEFQKTETFVDSDDEEHELIPLAGNIDDYFE